MTAKRVILRDVARADVEDTVDFYAREAGRAVADRFVSSLERALRSIGRNQATRSPRYGFELDLPGIRSKLLSQFPYLVFYVECDEHVEVWRVLHAHRDLPTWLRDGNMPL